MATSRRQCYPHRVRIQILDSPQATAEAAAADIAEHLRMSVMEHRRASLALSGGRSPVAMLAALAQMDLPWALIDVLQVDERIAPADSKDRNANTLRRALFEPAGVPPNRIHLMPVEAADPEAAAETYATTLERVAGTPPKIDVVHLGLGPDGHTASLVPGDPVLDETTALVALTGTYQGRRRMSITYPVLNHAHHLVWLVIGDDKADALGRLLAADPTIPAGRVEPLRATVFTDDAAAPRHLGSRVPPA